MRLLLITTMLFLHLAAVAQYKGSLSTIEFVQILNENEEEALYYYQNNWKVLRDMAIEKGYIVSYQLMQTQPSDDAPFQIMLITTYPDQHQYDLREDHFAELIEVKGPLVLLNRKKPSEFRRTLFGKEGVKTLQSK